MFCSSVDFPEPGVPTMSMPPALSFKRSFNAAAKL